MAPPPMQPSGGLGQPADLLPRFLARLIDYVLLGIVLFIINGLILGAMFAGSGTGALGLGTGNYGYIAVSSLINAAVYLGYFAFMESSRGQTVGKMALKLETRGPDGGRPTMEQALRRNAFTAIGIISLIPFIGGFIAWIAQLAAVITIAVTINNNVSTRHGWHDDFAGGTTVVKIG